MLSATAPGSFVVRPSQLDELITRTYTLEQINEAYADMLAGKNIRGVIEFK